MGSPPVDRSATRPLARRSLLAGVLVGIGVAGFIDETVFHQVLHWHHFYDQGSSDAGLVSDGFFHAGSWLCVVIGIFLFADLQRRHATVRAQVWGGGFLGWGAFQLYDGLVQHKLFGLHQIRYGVDLLPYDLAWDLAGVAGVAVGVVLLVRGRARA